MILKFSYDKGIHDDQIKIVFPVIAKNDEKLVAIANNNMTICKTSSLIKVSANHPVIQLPSTNGRVFNFVPGYEAIPFCIAQNHVAIEVAVV